MDLDRIKYALRLAIYSVGREIELSEAHAEDLARQGMGGSAAMARDYAKAAKARRDIIEETLASLGNQKDPT